MTSPLVVFDLDGTLVDTAPDLVNTLNVIFEREGYPAVPYETALRCVGGGARLMIARGLQAGGIAVTPEKLEQMFADFIGYYSAHISDHSRVFDGVERSLDDLAARGCTFAVCTNKLEGLSVQLLKALGLHRRFAAVCGQDTFKIAKPDPEVLRRTITAAGGDVQRTVFVGDSETDVLTARAAQVPIVAVSFGYSEPPVDTFKPDRLIHSYDALAQSVLELMAGRAAS